MTVREIAESQEQKIEEKHETGFTNALFCRY